MPKIRQYTGQRFSTLHQEGHGLTRRLIILALALLIAFLPSPTRAWSGSELPPFDAFAEGIVNGESDDLRGIYVPDVLADKIVSQPDGEPAFISSHPNTLTVFGMASRYDSIGLLAHNTLAGADFSLLEQGQIIHLIYGDGRIESYGIKRFFSYQALQPQSITSDFVDLETGELLSASKLFLKIFDRPGSLILQTCIYADGDNSWGRLFIIAEPLGSAYFWSMPNETGVRYY